MLRVRKKRSSIAVDQVEMRAGSMAEMESEMKGTGEVWRKSQRDEGRKYGGDGVGDEGDGGGLAEITAR